MLHAVRYWVFLIYHVCALHSPVVYSPAPAHVLAEGPGRPSRPAAGNDGFHPAFGEDGSKPAAKRQAWSAPSPETLPASLLTPVAATSPSGQVKQAQDTSTRNATVQLVLWACLAAIVSTLFVFVLVMAWMYCGGYQTSEPAGTNESLKSLTGSRVGGKSSMATSEHSVASVDSGALDSPRTTATSIIQGQLPGLPLCPLLVVPDGTRLGCVVQNDVCRMKQELSFDICAVPGRGGAPLFRARVSELSNEGPAIYVETLGGRDQLAYLSTEDLWRSASSPVLGISRPWGLPYGTMQKGENGQYVVVRGQSPLLTFAGDYLSHSIQVMVPSGHTIATTLQTSSEEYQVHMQARTDAGLVILGLLAIDKCEIATRSPGAGTGG
mmetsp:Transcript_113795/g.302420  ORF Transcript_113795/g.302420 Transcript_113795/m.302420 type:complete len:381 (-) Transcript_113795:158-1300(-)